MNYNLITDISQIDKKKWTNFVINHPNGNIFQSTYMYMVYKKTKNYQPIFLCVLDNQNNIFGLMVSVLQREFSNFIGNFTARSVIEGGPLIRDDNKKILDIILNEYNKLIGKRAIYTQFRNIWDWKNKKSIFETNGFIYQDHLDIINDLSISEDAILNEMHAKRRYGIRRAKNEGLSFKVSKDLQDLNECYNILKEVYTHAKLPIADFSLFKNLFEMTENNCGLKLFCATYNNEIIGCMLALVYKDIIYDYYAGAYKEYYSKYPNDFIPFEVFKWGIKKGYRLFDFGGAGKPGVPYGVRKYKEQFGGKLINFGRYEKVHNHTFMIIGKIGLKVYKLIKN
jgi:lipid II:glycine glycyltransferase (peptidoglycan interpeptide bridge formation enzyme)